MGGFWAEASVLVVAERDRLIYAGFALQRLGRTRGDGGVRMVVEIGKTVGFLSKAGK